MARMHKAAGQAARARVQVLVAAPRREVAVPVVQVHGHVANRVRQIESTERAGLVCCGGDGLHVQHLSREVVQSTDQHQRQRIALALDGLHEILRGEARLAVAWRHLHHMLCRVEAANAHVTLDGVGVAGEGARFHQDARALALGSPEAGEQQMQVHAETVHGHDLFGCAANQLAQRLAEHLVVVHPRVRALEARLRGMRSPRVEFLHHQVARGARHGPERVAHQIGDRGAGRVAGQFKSVAKACQRVDGIKMGCKPRIR